MARSYSLAPLGLMLVAALATPGGSPAEAEAEAADAVLKLVTEEEAALPDRPRSRRAARHLRSGPRVEIDSPEPEAVYQEPFPIRVRFFPGSSGLDVSMESLRVTYLKWYADIDLTDRLAPYVRPAEIDVPAVELPKGKHTVEIYIEDVEGNPSAYGITLSIEG